MLRPATKEAYELLQDGCIALAQVEANGFRVDMPYLHKMLASTAEMIREKEEVLRKDDIFTTWRKRYGQKANLGSRDQLAEVIFKQLGHKPAPTTKKKEEDGEYRKRPKADESAFRNVKLPFIKTYFEYEKIKKARGTYLEGFLAEQVDGYIHPFINLHTVVTYRSSMDRPNLQNIPVRNAFIGEMVRRCLIARPGNRLMEVDFKGVEVAIAACVTKDPVLISYIKDKTKDMHRDMAMECYMLTLEQVNKYTRYCAKNKFVFPQFYGDYYIACARYLWEDIAHMDLKTEQGVPLLEHLAAKGIHKLGKCDPSKPPQPGTFEMHIKEVEYDFWNRRFKAYTAWKKKWWEAYQNEGGFNTPTGFRVDGIYGRNKVLNNPIQGAAFHCLLWTLIQTQKQFTKYKLRSKIVNQVHDSMILDCARKEVRTVKEIVGTIVRNDLPKHYSWISVPLDIEAEISPVDGSWFEKKHTRI